MVSKVQAFQASDGCIYEDELLASYHEWEIKFQKFYEKNKIKVSKEWFNQNDSIHYYDIVDWLKINGEYILSLLPELIDIVRRKDEEKLKGPLRQEYRFVPRRENPDLNKDIPYKEVKVTCWCGAEYITLVNGTIPVPPVDDLKMVCANCGLPIQKFKSLSGHCGGVFNTRDSRSSFPVDVK